MIKKVVISSLLSGCNLKYIALQVSGNDSLSASNLKRCHCVNLMTTTPVSTITSLEASSWRCVAFPPQALGKILYHFWIGRRRGGGAAMPFTPGGVA
jgi:hypothetical protein